MRYRPLGARGQVVSSVSLILQPEPFRRRPGDWTSLIYAALECGVSGFEIRGLDGPLGEGLGSALGGVDRRLVFVALRLAVRRDRKAGLEAMRGQINAALAATGLDYLDAVLVEHPSDGAEVQGLDELSGLKSAGLVRTLGIAGSGETVDALVARGKLDLLATEYSLLSGWAERRRVRSAVASDMGVLGYGVFPRETLDRLIQPRVRNKANPLAGTGGYGFLQQTRDWTPEELCVAYALTEPGLASVQVRPESIDHLERLAAVTDRELPSGVAAQIEMARFSAPPEADAQRTA
jgi:aryl-alcohol dehydrogenase-like predicted oxidoreductase